MHIIDIQKNIENTIECNTKYCKSYFWQANQTHSARQSLMAKFARNYPDYEFEYSGDTYKVKHEYYESCKHCYYKLLIYKNDCKTNLTVLKTVLKRINKIEVPLKI
jgi:hypothetical protein